MQPVLPLPQLKNNICITNGGLETSLIFQDNFSLPYFAAFTLLRSTDGLAALQRHYQDYVKLADNYQVNCILETPTWRANADWGKKLGYSKQALDTINQESVQLLKGFRDQYENEATQIIITGCIGPKTEAYQLTKEMTIQEAQNYHRAQVNSFKAANADMITAGSLNYINEAIGIVKAAQQVEVPVVISFTVETDGKLLSGASLQTAIEKVDAITANGPIYYMINCAHPTHFKNVLVASGNWQDRIYGIRANASNKSHAELNEATELDAGNPTTFATEYNDLKRYLKNFTVFGGCCGTSKEHIEQVCQSCF